MADDKAEIRRAVEYIVTVFREPLEAVGTCIFALIDEVDEVVDFYRKYIESQDYRKSSSLLLIPGSGLIFYLWLNYSSLCCLLIVKLKEHFLP